MELKSSQRLNNHNTGDPNKSSNDKNLEAVNQKDVEQLKLDEMISKFGSKITSLERLYVQNCGRILQVIAPDYMCSEHFEMFLTENLGFPSLDKICNKIKKNPRNIFERIPGIQIHTIGFIHWLSLESDQPSFRRHKLERDDFLESLKLAELDLNRYTEKDKKDDKEIFKYLYHRYGTIYDSFADDIQLAVDEENEKKEESKKALHEKQRAPSGMEEEEEEKDVEEEPPVDPTVIERPRTTVDRMKVFRDIFDVDKRTLAAKKPPATQFVDNELTMALWLPFNRNYFGNVFPNGTRSHLRYDHILNVLAKRNVKTFNEFQRLVVNLIQYPFVSNDDVPLSNLLICAERFRGFTTALSAVLIERVAEYKRLNEYGEAMKELRFNKKPYILIVALNDVDCLPLYQAFQTYLKGCQISVPSCIRCTNVKFEEQLSRGCDILLIDRKKLEFIRSGQIDLCNLRHVVFLDIDRFIDGNQNLICDVHKFVQLALEKNRYDHEISDNENFNVQYIFQTYHNFTGWNSFERLLYLTQPVSDNVALILQYDYKAYGLNRNR